MPLTPLDADGPDLTIKEARAHLRVSRWTLYRYIKDERFEGAWQTQGSWRIPQRDLIAYRDRQAG